MLLRLNALTGFYQIQYDIVKLL